MCSMWNVLEDMYAAEVLTDNFSTQNLAVPDRIYIMLQITPKLTRWPKIIVRISTRKRDKNTVTLSIDTCILC